MTNRTSKIIGGVVIALAAFGCFALFTGRSEASDFEFQKGMCYTSWHHTRYSSNASDESLKALAATGTKWVALLVTWYQEKCDSTTIAPGRSSPTDESLAHAINQIHSLGMKVMLKPHLDILDTSDGSWRGEISCSLEPDWNAWFDSYGAYISHYAKIAQDNNVEMLCIGTELTSAATVKGDLWRSKVISGVRQIYSGKLTYAANWSEEFTHVKFWDEMDYVGIDAYFPISDKERPTIEEIKKGWEPWVKEIEEFQAQVNKPIIFPEVGYCSITGTTKMPWEQVTNGTVDLALQADCYQALLETFWEKDWFYGVYWWKWGTDTRFGGPLNKGYSPQNKPAENVVKTWNMSDPVTAKKY